MVLGLTCLVIGVRPRRPSAAVKHYTTLLARLNFLVPYYPYNLFLSFEETL